MVPCDALGDLYNRFAFININDIIYYTYRVQVLYIGKLPSNRPKRVQTSADWYVTIFLSIIKYPRVVLKLEQFIKKPQWHHTLTLWNHIITYRKSAYL